MKGIRLELTELDAEQLLRAVNRLNEHPTNHTPHLGQAILNTACENA